MKALKEYCLLSYNPYCKILIQEDVMEPGDTESEMGKWHLSRCN